MDQAHQCYIIASSSVTWFICNAAQGILSIGNLYRKYKHICN